MPGAGAGGGEAGSHETVASKAGAERADRWGTKKTRGTASPRERGALADEDQGTSLA